MLRDNGGIPLYAHVCSHEPSPQAVLQCQHTTVAAVGTQGAWNPEGGILFFTIRAAVVPRGWSDRTAFCILRFAAALPQKWTITEMLLKGAQIQPQFSTWRTKRGSLEKTVLKRF